MLFDTDVLIWVLRGSAKAIKMLESSEECSLSVVNYMELLQGARDRREAKNIRAFLVDFGFDIVPLSENIGHRASIYMEQFGLKVALGATDALIAATAVEHQLMLCTANHKHYKPIAELELKIFTP
ncbi:MAG: type II toxin-antitoxin system VapC family toxin [Pirellulales bacterium]|nr:type II toxin-antitoxin system VapC family toxin [Pirellulales bacterium]